VNGRQRIAKYAHKAGWDAENPAAGVDRYTRDARVISVHFRHSGVVHFAALLDSEGGQIDAVAASKSGKVKAVIGWLSHREQAAVSEPQPVAEPEPEQPEPEPEQPEPEPEPEPEPAEPTSKTAVDLHVGDIIGSWEVLRIARMPTRVKIELVAVGGTHRSVKVLRNDEPVQVG
jgi:hypothetical protein